MSLLLHAIVPADPAAPRPACVSTDRLSACATDWDQRPLTRAEMLAHHGLVSRLHVEHEACLPARFPTVVADAAALRALLVRREPELLGNLERVRGRTELAVTAVWTQQSAAEPMASTTPGRQYLLQRQRDFHSADAQRAIAAEIADAVERALGADVVEAQRKLCPRPDTALSLALLVPRAGAQQLVERVPDADELRGVRILVNGPWPPYSFVALVTREE
ncbi:MAG TPA: GvpL/GvpF family gas vesicle protein [Chloroflexota bacterium]